MRRCLSLFLLFCTMVLSLPAAADHLDGVVPLTKDDLTAVTQLKTMPERHVMLYFGDYAN